MQETFGSLDMQLLVSFYDTSVKAEQQNRVESYSVSKQTANSQNKLSLKLKLGFSFLIAPTTALSAAIQYWEKNRICVSFHTLIDWIYSLDT